MRYVIAIALAIVAAFTATVLVSSPIASAIVAGMRFDSPDEVARMHALLFMACNAAALVVGWLLGLAIGARLERPDAGL